MTPAGVADAVRLRDAGASRAAIARHYDVSDDFFALWLGERLVYSCALWDGNEPARSDPPAALAAAQQRKLDFFADRLDVANACVLDVGCGWGALLDRFVTARGAASGVGITLSEAQQRYASRRGPPGVTYAVESWVDHEPAARYDAITCVEATEHFASDRSTPEQKVAVYEAFFARCADWLRDGGRVGLQLICQDNVGHATSRPGQGPASELIRRDIFPESMPAALSELVVAWEPYFSLASLDEHSAHYRRTFRAWSLALRARRDTARELVGDDVVRTFERYLAAGEVFFRLREHALHRVILRKRPRPKRWRSRLDPAARPGPSASPAAVQAHYDVSNAFYALWLGPTMQYTSGMWSAGDDPSDLEAAHARKLDFFADRVLRRADARVLDIGCGWGGNLRRLLARPDVVAGVGLTLSDAQSAHIAAHPLPDVAIRVESWRDHQPHAPYDGIFCYGAFEHFARDGSTRAERIATYTEFFARCYDWLSPGGGLALETLAHDDAPDTAAPRGRGPLGNAVLDLYPESLCPHLHEIVVALEPTFELEVLRSDAADFARTMRLWHVRLRDRAAEAARVVDPDVVRRYRAYLASSEVQLRTGLLTNYRFVLRRRPRVRR